MTTPKPSRKRSPKLPEKAKPKSSASPSLPSAFDKAMHDLRQSPGAFPNVSARWLLVAAGVAVLTALGCAWLTLCLLYWQGSWQLLYHPRPTIGRTPASIGLSFESIKFATTETGQTQLTGWWIPSSDSRFTVLYLHGADGNLSDTLEMLAALHKQNLNVFAVDYREYGQSRPIQSGAHPNEKQLHQDAEWALTWLTLTRQIPPKQVILFGSDLGANLAAELAADHSELAGLVLDRARQDPMAQVFSDGRSRLVPAHWMVKDRYDLSAASASLEIPSLWLFSIPPTGSSAGTPAAYQLIAGPKNSAWLKTPITADPGFAETLRRWLDDL